ncbi:hypothetical protein, partial [Rhizobium sp. R635]|uniref:hypothetical protein n=1 Tax=Rhizobium sp. R635 TaxID=1764275 RepID=UPI001AECEAA4
QNTNQHQPIRLSFTRTSNFVASSAAALVSEWAYRTNPPKQSTALFEKNDISFNSLFLHRNFRPASKYGRFPDSDPPERAGKTKGLRLYRGKNALSSQAPRLDHNLLVLRDARFTQAKAGRLPFRERFDFHA